MMYLYRAITSEGKPTSGNLPAASKEKAIEMLQKENYASFDIFESNTKEVKNAVSAKELSVFSSQMSILFFSNITLLEGIKLIADQAENTYLKTVLKEIAQWMEQGISFAECIGMYPHIFSSYFTSTVMVGEITGTLDETFAMLSDYYEKESAIRKRVKTAAGYPLMLTGLMFCIVLLLILKILPMFNDILVSMGGNMPSYTRVIMSVSAFIGNYFFVILLVVFALIVGIWYYTHRTATGKKRFDKFKLTFPLTKSIYSPILSGRFARSLAVLLKSGIQILNGLDYVTSLIDNEYMNEQLTQCFETVKNGAPLVEALETIQFFPPLLLKMISIGEKAGRTDEMLIKCANIFDEEAGNALDKLTLLLEPLLIIILSVIVGVILISVMLPMISIMANIG